MFKYHNFKKTGAYYVSKCGHDSNPGTDPNAPKRSPLTVAAVYGTGVYQGVVNMTNQTGDGKAVIIGGTFTGNSGSTTDMEYRGTRLGFQSSTSTITRDRCVFRGCMGGGGQSANQANIYNDCIFIDCVEGIAGRPTGYGGSVGLHQCIAINSQINITGNQTGQLTNSYIDPESLVFFAIPTMVLRNNCIQGQILYNGQLYEVKRKKDGTPAAGTDPALPDFVDVYPALYTNKNFNEPPKFNDMGGEDFTLQADSPLIRATDTGVGNIGGFFAKVATSVMNSDDGGQSGTRVMASLAVNTIIPTSYILKEGYAEGYIDYVLLNGGNTIANLDLKALFDFNSDITGGQIGNKNVPDAEPVTSEYPLLTTTTAANTALNLITVPTGKIAVGQHVRVNGQPRQVIGKTTSGGNDTLTLNADFLAAIGSGVPVTYGTDLQLAALNPNRLTVLMRTKSTASAPTIPFVDSEWDNELDAAYGKTGYLFNQEVNTRPELFIDGMSVYGGGDSDCPTGLNPQTLAPEWVQLRVYIRNNYNTQGLPA